MAGIPCKTFVDKGGLSMDPWEVFSELCRQVVEEQNVYLEVIISNGAIGMSLYPLEDLEGEDE